MKTWSIMAQKGGVGKTTTVVNLAGALARRGHSVVLIDLDPHGSCSSYFGFKPNSDDRNVHELFAAAVKKEVCAIGDLPRPTSTPRLSIISSATALVSLERRCGTVTGMGSTASFPIRTSSEREGAIIAEGALKPRRPRVQTLVLGSSQPACKFAEFQPWNR